MGDDDGVTRRAALGLGLAGLAGAACAAAGIDWYVTRLPPGVPDIAPGSMHAGSFVSRYRRGVRVGWRVAYPPNHDGAHLPVLVTLHAREGSCVSVFDGLHFDRFLAAAVASGTPPFAIASIDGGDHEYWHPRADGDPAGMVVHEFVPLLADHGLRTARIGLFGWSMGGYGTLYLAERLGAERVAVAVAESPAIWQHSWQSAGGAFDDAADFDHHAVLGRHLRRLRGIALRVDCGAADGFAPITRELRAAIRPTPAGGIEPGGHDSAYWRSQAPGQLAFVGRHIR
jgi:enterochelin esterase-like enzyme